MALKTIMNQQSDFTGEFPVQYAKSGLWRFNESTVDEDDCVSDSSGTGNVSVTSEYTSGVTSVNGLETSTSDDLESWSEWHRFPLTESWHR